jgi:dolichol-phosphate mannosyltransferase
MDKNKVSNSLIKSKHKKGQKIVDLKCGDCDWNTDNLEVYGVDTNSASLKRAKEANRLYDYKIANASDTGLPDESFDIVTDFELPEDTSIYEKIIAEAARLLKKGGYFILSERYFSSQKNRDAFGRYNFDVESFFYLRKSNFFLCAKKRGTDESRSQYSDITVILPTLNEERNILNVLRNIISYYKNCNIIVTDDGSTDATKKMALSAGYENLVFLDRSKEPVHGLTASVLDAANLVKTEYFVVMDADGQHPYETIEDIVNILRFKKGMVIASRAEVEDEWPLLRKTLSYAGTLLAKISLLVRGKNYLTCDILSGFFGCDLKSWKEITAKGITNKDFRLKGYKVLFDFLKMAPKNLTIEEVYYKFATRQAEMSKINLKVYMEFLKSCFSR